MKFLSFLLLLSALFVFGSKPLNAQSQNIIVEPQLIQLDLSKDRPQAEYFYTNNTSETIELSLSMQDVKELQDRGIPEILNVNDSKNYQYGLSSWTRLSTNSLIIAPKEKKSVTVYIDNERLSPGGHYGTLLAEIKQFDEGRQVQLRAILSSLLFVRAGLGGEIEEAEIVNLRFLQNFYAYPTNAFFNLQNTGNVDLTPHGILTIKDPFVREITRTIVNEDSLITLPDSSRQYAMPIVSKIAILPPGIYTATLDVRYGKTKTEKREVKKFFSLGILTVDKILIIVLFGGVTSFVLLKLSRRQNRIK